MQIDDKTLKDIAAKYGTPAFVFDTAALKARMSAVRGILGGSIKLCYSIKANPFLIKQMAEIADNIEVCSPGELTICESSHIDMDKIVFSGVNKTADDVARAVADKADIYTAESVKHMNLLEAEAEKQDVTLPVLLRLTSGNQFGVDEAQFCDIIKRRAEYKSLDIVGIHYFAGTQRKRLADRQKELAMLDALIEKLKTDYNFDTKKLEYGPGLPVPYFEKDDFSDTLAPCREIAADLQKLADKTELTVEMGRFFTAECGCYITAVNDIKQSRDTLYAIVDGGINHLNYYGQTMAMQVPVIRQIPQGGQVKENYEQKTYAICGSLCTISDVLVRSVTLNELHEGDLLIFENTGAYSVTEGMYLFLSRKMPNVILYDGEKAKLVRGMFETDKINTAKE